MDTEDVEEAPNFEEGIEDMLNDVFYDVLPNEDLIVDEEAQKRKELESEIKEQCNKLLYEGAKVSNLQVLLGLLTLQTVYGFGDGFVSIATQNSSRGELYARNT